MFLTTDVQLTFRLSYTYSYLSSQRLRRWARSASNLLVDRSLGLPVPATTGIDHIA